VGGECAGARHSTKPGCRPSASLRAFSLRRATDARERAHGSIRATRSTRAIRCLSPVPEILIVAEASAARGLWAVRVDIRSSGRSAAANRAAALRRVGWRGIDSTSTVGAVGLCIRRLSGEGHSQNARAYETDQSALHHDLPFGEQIERRLRPYEANPGKLDVRFDKLCVICVEGLARPRIALRGRARLPSQAR
jgi:hypothetical protein